MALCVQGKGKVIFQASCWSFQADKPFEENFSKIFWTAVSKAEHGLNRNAQMT